MVKAYRTDYLVLCMLVVHIDQRVHAEFLRTEKRDLVCTRTPTGGFRDFFVEHQLVVASTVY